MELSNLYKNITLDTVNQHGLDISLTTYCQARCRSCDRTDSITGEKNSWLPLQHMDYNVFCSLVDNMSGIDWIRFAGEYGDPLMYPKLTQAIDYCFKNNIKEYGGEYIEDVIDKDNLLTINLRRKLIKECQKDMIEKSSLLDEVYKEDFKKDEDRWPTKWMLNNKGIIENLNKWKYTIPILNYLWRNKKSLNESKAISLTAGITG